MRYFDHLKSQKNLARAKTLKTKYRHKRIPTKGYSRQRTQRAAVKGNWKVIPKDSCEIYRERKRLQSERRNRNQDTIDKRNGDLAEEENVKGDRYKQRRKTRKKSNRKEYRKTQKHKKRTQRYSSGSSVSSYTSTSITISCSSYSDMDLD